MPTKDILDDAVKAHALWKKRLQDAIESGQSEFQVATVKKDNACSFGQILYNLPEKDQKSDLYPKILALHAEFHNTAAKVLEMALAGKKEEALHMISFEGEYSRTSGKLVLALTDWKNLL